MTRSRSKLCSTGWSWTGSDRVARGPGQTASWPTRPIRRSNRAYLTGRKIKAAIPIKDDQVAARRRKGRAGGRPPAFDPFRYRDRNTVERAVNKLRETRAVATRYDKRDYIYRGTITVSTIRIWLRDPALSGLSDTP